MSVRKGAGRMFVTNYKKGQQPIFRDATDLNSFEAALLSEVGSGIETNLPCLPEALASLGGKKEDSPGFSEIDRSR